MGIAWLAALLQEGIAAGYPGDAGIAKDPRVLFHEDFEAGDVAALSKRWGEAAKPENFSFAEGAIGKRSLKIARNGHLFTHFAGADAVYARFTVKFHERTGYLHHFVHLIADGEPTPWPKGHAGKKPDGAKGFSTGIEPYGDGGRHPAPGVWHFYSYWHEMKPDGRGDYWGNGFEAVQDPIVPGRWITVEFMIKANSAPDQVDGAQAFWIDGKKVGEFGGLRWRTSNLLKINSFWLLHYNTDQPARQNKDAKVAERVNDVWFDDIVVATAYIGPVAKAR